MSALSYTICETVDVIRKLNWVRWQFFVLLVFSGCLARVRLLNSPENGSIVRGAAIALVLLLLLCVRFDAVCAAVCCVYVCWWCSAADKMLGGMNIIVA